MNKFITYSNGAKFDITMGELLEGKGITPKFEVLEVRKENKLIYENKICSLGFKIEPDRAFLVFEGNKLIEITKSKKLVDYLYDKSKFHMLYYFTTCHWRNWED